MLASSQESVKVILEGGGKAGHLAKFRASVRLLVPVGHY